jgi:Ca-activated chloride channel family protein
LCYAFRLQPEVGVLATTSPTHLGTIPLGASLTVILELMMEGIPQNASQFPLLEGMFKFDIPSRPTPTSTMRFQLHRPVAVDDEPPPPPQAIVNALSRLTLFRLQEKARSELAAGDIPSATRRLHNLATNLLAQGQYRLAQDVVAEIKRLEQGQSLSQEGEKKIKYGTRNLLLPPSTERDT